MFTNTCVLDLRTSTLMWNEYVSSSIFIHNKNIEWTIFFYFIIFFELYTKSIEITFYCDLLVIWLIAYRLNSWTFFFKKKIIIFKFEFFSTLQEIIFLKINLNLFGNEFKEILSSTENKISKSSCFLSVHLVYLFDKIIFGFLEF